MKTKSNVSKTALQVAKEVLNEAANADHFFDQSDGERLLWMLARAFKHGVSAGIATQCVMPPCTRCPIIGCQKPSMN